MHMSELHELQHAIASIFEDMEVSKASNIKVTPKVT